MSTKYYLLQISAILLIVSWRRQWHPTPVPLPGKSHGQRSLVGCSPWSHWESDTTEQLHFHFSLFCIGEGNGNPLQCSYLENPRDGGAWWADIYGVTQSQTRLKWLSSSSRKASVCSWSRPTSLISLGDLAVPWKCLSCSNVWCQDFTRKMFLWRKISYFLAM